MRDRHIAVFDRLTGSGSYLPGVCDIYRILNEHNAGVVLVVYIPPSHQNRASENPSPGPPPRPSRLPESRDHQTGTRPRLEGSHVLCGTQQHGPFYDLPTVDGSPIDRK